MFSHVLYRRTDRGLHFASSDSSRLSLCCFGHHGSDAGGLFAQKRKKDYEIDEYNETNEIPNFFVSFVIFVYFRNPSLGFRAQEGFMVVEGVTNYSGSGFANM